MPETQNNQLVDGVDNNERAIGTVGVKPSMDAIAEVSVVTNLYSAETGRTLGGVVNILTKSGANTVHGSAFEFVRNDRFDARDYFAKQDPVLRQHQFGGSMGGPIVRDRTFFFADYEGLRATQGVTNLITVPTAKMRAGDFSEVTATIFDPTLSPRVAFPGNVIPSNRFASAALRYLSLVPLPNLPGLANNYASTTDRTQDSDTADFRVDHRFNSSNMLFGRYSYNSIDTFSPGACPVVGGVNPGCISGQSFPGPNESTAHHLVLSYVRVLNPTALMDVKFGYIRPNLNSLPANYGTDLGAQFGIQNANVPGLPVTSGLPLMTITGFASLGDAGFIPLRTADRTKQILGTFSKTSGAHNLKIGGAMIFREFTVEQSGSPKGSFAFDALVTNNGSGSGGHPVASFLLGLPTTVIRALVPFNPLYYTNEPSVYVQDDWRTTSWLTLNLGARYEVFTPFTEEENRLTNFDPATSRILVAGQKGVSRSADVKTDWNNIAPRFGFSASLPRRMVLRGGYGLAYFPSNMGASAYLKNPPFTANYGPITSNASSGLLPTIRLSDGLPAVANNSLDNLTGSLSATALDFKANKAQQYNVILEKEFGGNVLAVGYLGSRGSDIAPNVGVTVANINLAPAGPGAIQQRRPYFAALPGINNITVYMNHLESRYNAMQLVFQRRHRSGLSFNTHYTLGHAEQTTPAPWNNLLTEWGDAPNDIRHRGVLTANYELPWGKSLKGVMRGLLSDWQVNAAVFYQTGTGFTVSNAAARMNTGGADRPNLIGNPQLPASQRTVQRWFNTAAFEAQPQFTAGNIGATLMHGPPNRRLDMSFFKSLPLQGRSKLQLRAEIYNLTDTANFANPNSQFGNAAFGTISSTGNAIPRQMQFAAKVLF